MTDQFHIFAKAVRAHFDAMAQETLFVVSGDADAIWEHYLAAFPAGSNPIFRERTEHDCSCCRHFIRSIGNVVAIQNGALVSIWDLSGLPEHYQAVADTMAAYMRSLPIADVFLTPMAKHGTAVSHEIIEGQTRTWNHFAIEVPLKHVSRDWAENRGHLRTTHQMLMRAVRGLTAVALATVRELIVTNAIYRGAEFARSVAAFEQMRERILSAGEEKAQELTAWGLIDNPVARFRNTVIGTLVQDLSDGVDLPDAVRIYESKVAPQNYKRPKALISKGMIEKAMKTIEELGLEGALERRHARLSDVSVESVLFVDNAVQGELKGGLKGLLMEEVRPAAFDPKAAEEIGVDRFVAEVLPRTKSLRAYLANGLLGNFVSLTAPVHDDSKSLFRWGNDFAWSYDGNVTDSIKEKVKRAGGQVENVAMRVSLAWYNFDDLDIHVQEPDGTHVYFANKANKLDVDMNAHVGRTREPVENIRWVRTPADGIYKVWVNNFSRREAIDVGFEVEIESGHGVNNLRFERAVGNKENVPVAEITVANGAVALITASREMLVGSAAREQWGLKTLDLVRVNALVLSPNYWGDSAVGNKHWFFILDGCRNPLPTRGIYNEFLSSALEPHRKVFEVLGDKTKCPVADEQLSGIGFSSTRSDKLMVMASGPKMNRPYAIVFGKE